MSSLYRCCSTTIKTKVFASGRNSHRTSQLAAEKHSFLSKCPFTTSHEHNDSFHDNLIPSCKHRLWYYIGIIQIFEQLRVFIVWKHVWPPDASCVPETWSLKFRMISQMTNHQRQAVHLWHSLPFKNKSRTFFRRFN